MAIKPGQAFELFTRPTAHLREETKSSAFLLFVDLNYSCSGLSSSFVNVVKDLTRSYQSNNRIVICSV